MSAAVLVSRSIWPALVAVAASLGSSPTTSTTVPRGAAAVIDGRLETAEWADAATVELGPGATARLKHDGRDLFVSLTAPAPLLANVCITHGDTVRVLHASASLGDAIYRPVADAWHRHADFAWALRDGTPDNASASARDAFFAAHGWIASTVGANAAGREYRILLDAMDVTPRLTIAVVSLIGAGATWPASATHQCQTANFAFGTALESAKFNPAGWEQLTIAR